MHMLQNLSSVMFRNNIQQSTAHVPKWSPDNKALSANLYALQKLRNPNMALEREGMKKLWDTHEKLLHLLGFMEANCPLSRLRGRLSIV